MPTALDLDAYFARIRWAGDRTPTLATLEGLLRAHVSNIPFENLDVLLGRGVKIDLPSIEAKLVRARRGGYCFEHATLFDAVLEAIGFQPVRHAARVVLFTPLHAAPRTHMFLTVTVEGATFVVDPGFGPFASLAPVPLADGATGPHRMVRDGARWTLQVPRDGQTVDAWVTTLEVENPIDFAVANHFVATHPESPFVNLLMLSAVTPDGRVNVMNRDVTILREGRAQTAQISDRAALRALLATRFGFDLPEAERLVVPAIPDWR